jgi:hypothetical protein
MAVSFAISRFVSRRQRYARQPIPMALPTTATFVIAFVCMFHFHHSPVSVGAIGETLKLVQADLERYFCPARRYGTPDREWIGGLR